MAGIIKAHQMADGSAPTPAAVHWMEMSEELRRLREDAKRQAEAILEAARYEAQAIRQQAEAQGRAEAVIKAEQAARRLMEERLESLLPALQQAEAQLNQMRQQWVYHWEKHLVALACAIAGKILRREVQHQPELALHLVRESLEMASGWNPVTIELHPDDFTALEPHWQQLIRQWSRTVHIDFAPNPELDKGSCRVVGRWGEIDQTFRAQLDRIQKELLE